MTKLEALQKELFALRKKRTEITFEKGMIAEDSKDLRENGAYAIMEEQENMITGKIRAVTLEIHALTKKPIDKKTIKKDTKKVEPLKPHKWL